MTQTLETRTLGHIYWIVVMVSLTAASSLLLNYQSYLAFLLVGLVPLLLIGSRFERVVFDGQRVKRRGPLAFLELVLFGRPQILTLDDIEMIATEAIRSRRGLNQIKYLYRLTLAGNNVQINILVNISRKNSRYNLIKNLLNALDENKLDPRTSELKQYLNDQIPKDALFDLANKINGEEQENGLEQSLPTSLLRQLANSLKLEGRMQQAFRCFTLAYKRDPRNAQLLYEMARFLRSLAMIDNPRLLSRSRACLRLAAFLAKDEPHLLERIGETHFERFEYKLASRCFLRALTIEPGLYRANIGLAEIALRNGKLAHVVHFYSAAATASHDRAQQQLANREASYYGRLCSDEDYFEAEINRITKLKNFQWARNLSALLLFISWALALLSGSFSNDISNLAWSVVFTSCLVWLGSVLLARFYTQRSE